MTRKLALVVAACLGLFHEAAWALGLGDIDVDSALNQPFEATIALRNTDTLERNEIIANLASVEDFERVGVERFFFLSDLAFETDLSDPRTPVLRVTTSQPVTEPFVNFVVEVLWPSGRLLKEFTILLDPPTYAARPMAAPQVPATSGAIRTAPAPTAAPASPAPAAGSGVGAFVGDTYGVTDRNDTLWDIALKVRADASLSVHQTMLALLRLNPEAFIGGNINQLKAGYVLRVPNAEEVRRLSLDDAVVQVAEQNDRWRSGLDRAPLDARERVAGVQGSGGSGGELRLVSGTEDVASTTGRRTGGSGTGSSPAATGSADGALQAELVAARSQLDAARQQNASLRGEMQSTSTEVDELQRQIQVRDEQIARLQAAVQQQMQAQQSSAPPPTTAPSSTAAAAAGGLFGFSWLIIGAAVAGLLVLGVVVLLVLRRLSGGSSDDDITDFPEASVERKIDETQLMPALTAADLGGSEEAGDDGAGEDVLAEADVYMAYGNFSEAAAALGAALEADPNRADIRLKLLEVHVEQGDVDAFNEQAFALQGIADEATVAEADRLAARLPGAATSTGEITSGDAVAPAREGGEGAMSLDFDLALDGAAAQDDGPADLDSLDIDLDLGDEGAAGADASEEVDLDFGLDLDGDDAADDDLDLGDDLGLDIDGDEPAAIAAADGAEDEFELALEGDGEDDDDGALPDIDFDLEDDEKPAKAADDDAELDFDIDALDGGDGEDAPAVTSESAADFADRTVILGGDDLEAALEVGGDADDDDGLSFDIDDLAEPGGAADAEPAAGGALELGDDLDFDDDLDLGDDSGAAGNASGSADTDQDEDLTELLPQDDSGLDADLDFELDEEFDFSAEDDADEISTKLELARAYVDMGDEEGAKEILDEVVRDGDDGQKKEAGDLLAQIG